MSTESASEASGLFLHISIEGDTVRFEYLFSRGEAYNKKNIEKLRNRDS